MHCIHNYMPGKFHVFRVRNITPSVVAVVTVLLHAECPFGYLKRQLEACTDLSQGYYWTSVSTSFFSFFWGAGIKDKNLMSSDNCPRFY